MFHICMTMNMTACASILLGRSPTIAAHFSGGRAEDIQSKGLRGCGEQGSRTKGLVFPGNFILPVYLDSRVIFTLVAEHWAAAGFGYCKILLPCDFPYCNRLPGLRKGLPVGITAFGVLKFKITQAFS